MAWAWLLSTMMFRLFPARLRSKRKLLDSHDQISRMVNGEVLSESNRQRISGDSLSIHNNGGCPLAANAFFRKGKKT
jgi:hypothetical protein